MILTNLPLSPVFRYAYILSTSTYIDVVVLIHAYIADAQFEFIVSGYIVCLLAIVLRQNLMCHVFCIVRIIMQKEQ